MSQYHETSNEAHESWQEMQEALHEAYEIQEQEADLRGEVNGTRIVTPAVIIRITLAPVRGRRTAVFGSPRAIVGATSARVQTAPLSGAAYVPIRTQDTATGQTAAKGVVYVPQRGGNVVQAATWAPRGVSTVQQAGRWLRRQIVQTPTLRKRIRKVQVLVDGKPCQHCVKQLTASVRPVTPPNTPVGVRFTPALSAASAPARRVAAPIRTVAQRPLRRPYQIAAPGPLTTPRRSVANVGRPAAPVAARPRTTPLQAATRPTARPAAPTPLRATQQQAARPRDPQTGKFVSPKPALKPGAPQSVLGKALREVGL